jgi:hypothetical protein
VHPFAIDNHDRLAVRCGHDPAPVVHSSYFSFPSFSPGCGRRRRRARGRSGNRRAGLRHPGDDASRHGDRRDGNRGVRRGRWTGHRGHLRRDRGRRRRRARAHLGARHLQQRRPPDRAGRHRRHGRRTGGGAAVPVRPGGPRRPRRGRRLVQPAGGRGGRRRLPGRPGRHGRGGLLRGRGSCDAGAAAVPVRGGHRPRRHGAGR